MQGMSAHHDPLPAFHLRRSIQAEDLLRLEEPAVIFEGTHTDSDGQVAYLYTVAGWLDGQNIATIQGGATLHGEVILIHADSRAEADAIAGYGLEDTINAMKAEKARHLDALAAQARLATVGKIDRMDLALKPLAERSDRFAEDMAKIRPLIGDDIVLAAGRVEAGEGKPS